MAIANLKLQKPKGPGAFYSINQGSLSKPLFTLELAKDYGDIVKYPGVGRAYLINNPDYIQYALLRNPKNYIKGGMAYWPVRAALGNGLITLQDEAWQKRREILNPLFQPKQVSLYANQIVATTKKYIANWRDYSHKRQPLDIGTEMMKLMLSITYRVFFATDIDPRTSEAILHNFGKINKYSCTSLCVLPWLPTPSNIDYRIAKFRMRTIIKDLIQQYRNRSEPSNDLLAALIDAHDHQAISQNDLIDEIQTFIATGHETTGISLSWVWYLLGQHPECYHRLEDEIRLCLQGQDGQYQDLERLEYTKMILEETMRLYPPIWIFGRKAVADDTIGNYYIKAGSAILICPFVLHRLAEIWPNPLDFIPERFSKENKSSHHRFAYIPFGVGQRICIANHFAFVAATLALATILQHYQIELLSNQDIGIQGYISLRPETPIWATVKER